MSFPLKNDREKAKDFLYDYILAVLADPEASAGWRQLNMDIGINITDLELGFTLHCSPDKVEAAHGYPEKPDAGLILSSNTFHKLFTGKGNPMMEFAMGKIKTAGDMGAILKIVGFLPQNVKVYQQFLTDKGLA
ncbi:MAG: SCP2 sterol-binding domain-containing protein [Clostridia bacterium]|nr:SCP2 sterol-binding domain-containing protein [Clostridia bacterium]